MKDLEWNTTFTVVLNMKSQIRYFREEHGFQVPPPTSYLTSYLLIYYESVRHAITHQTVRVVNMFAIYVVARVCGPSVWSVQSFDLLACKLINGVKVLSKLRHVPASAVHAFSLGPCSQSFRSLVSGQLWQGLRIGRSNECDGGMVAQPSAGLHGPAHRSIQDPAIEVLSSIRHEAP
jgi:hypothetical protein